MTSSRRAALSAALITAFSLILLTACSNNAEKEGEYVVEISSAQQSSAQATPAPTTPAPTFPVTPVVTPVATAVIEITEQPLYTYVDVPSEDVSSGLLVLVNYANAYEHTDEVEKEVLALTEYKTKHLLLDRADSALLREPLDALNEFSEAFFTVSGGDTLLVTSAFRTLQYQKDVYSEYVQNHGEEMAKIYVADPGSSEHHTGLTVDLSCISKDGERVPLIEHKDFEWVTANCASYGFILRYPVGSEKITHVAYEPWHFRYIGKTHAEACSALGMLYEDYIEHLKAYGIESGMLHISHEKSGEAALGIAELSALPDEGSLIYYVKAEKDGKTQIPIPYGCNNYTVSGNNEDGFIVTITL